MRTICRNILVSAVCAVGSVTHAAPIDFDLSAANSSVTVSSSPLCAPISVCGATGSLAAGLDDQVRSLEIGESWTFDFFTLSFFGFGVGFSIINATLGFDLPSELTGVGSMGVAGYATVFGEATGVVLSWDPIAPITLADGSSFRVEFESMSDVETAGDLTVHATISRGPVASVPEPTSLAIMGLGAIALSQLRRKRS